MNADAHLNLETLNHAALKRAMGCFATGIAVVTTQYEGGDFGMTCNSFNTVSLDPPMVLWSVQKTASSHAAFTRSSGYSVSLLAADQRDIAMHFTRGTPAERFSGVATHRLDSGRIVVDGAVAWFDCALDNVVPAGDHDVLIGRVLDFASNDRPALGYLRGQFMELGA
ncbi:flavin reductase family protein [Oricola sp.]|uniref:flavin reductase family protein n=1 Tax=Oricola sp. TaxID=1979950 RepID=UPI0025CC9525|nr:flavin reductase family protein [Oricola sp.]MCI5077116.1 flavin reductase family protein [Oricola sp.]